MPTAPIAEFRRELGESVLDSPADLAVYSYDGALDRGRPDAVLAAGSAEEVRRAVAWCARRGVPFTARGAGTNLSGGCIPARGGVVIALSRLNRILEVDAAAGVAVVEPGVVNLELQKELARVGRFYAPDPASFKVSTLGGNIAENAGGPRCLKYGVTTNHVLALEAVLPDGSVERFSLSDRGPELMSLLVGAEGTLGVVTKAWVRTLPLPGTIRTVLAGFGSIEASVECVSAIVAAGVVPRVLEAMDRVTVESVESFVGAGYPRAEAVLLIELDGSPEEVARDWAEVEPLLRRFGAGEIRTATDPVLREKLWEGRRGAYAAMARLAPNVLVEDGVVPRDKLPEIVRRINAVLAREKLTAGLLFHAGDGNIHPNIAFDERDAALTARVKRAGHEILRSCVELGGSLSGEHGIGLDKRDAMAWLFTPETLDLFRRVKRAFDPAELSNPEKLFPLPGAPRREPGYVLPPGPPLGEQALRLQAQVRRCAAEGRPMAVCGSLSRLGEPPPGHERLETAGLSRVLELDRGNLSLRVEAGMSPRALRLQLRKQGLFLRLPDAGGTVGGLLAAKAWEGLREDLLGMRLLLSDGAVVELGGKVFKNVAGYELPRCLLGSWGTLAVILDVTLKLHARPPAAPREPRPSPFAAGAWARRLKSAFDPPGLFNSWLLS